MEENVLKGKVSRISRGSKISVVPLSQGRGDPIDTMGLPCPGFGTGPVTFTETFFARLDNFDGEVMYVHTREHYCVKISIGHVRDVLLVTTSKWEE